MNSDALRSAMRALDDDDEPAAPAVPSTEQPQPERLPDGRCAKTGRFLTGWKGGPGAPRRPDAYALAVEGAARDGIDLRARVWAVLKSLLAQAEAGDVQAARVVLGHLCANEQVAVAFAAELSTTDRLVRLQAILTQAAARPDTDAD